MCQLLANLLTFATVSVIAVAILAVIYAPPKNDPPPVVNVKPPPPPPEKYVCKSTGFEKKTETLLSTMIKDDKEKNVIVFGETGVGKSSLINMIMNANIAKVSDQAAGVTFEHQKFPFLNFNIYDTIGLGEPDGGTVNKKKAISELLKLMTKLKKSSGINLIILVMKKGRINDILKSNYKLIVEIMTDFKVPVVLVVTHANEEKVRNKWIQDNRKLFLDHKLKFIAETTVCGTPMDGLTDDMQCYYKNCLLESRFDVLKFIQDKSLKEPYRIPELNFEKRISFMFNFMFDYFNSPLPLWKDLSDFLKQQGFDPVEAVKLVNDMFK